MMKWLRFEHEGVVGFGTLTGETIDVHDGNLFDGSTATGTSLALADVTVLTPTTAGKMLALWNNSRAMAAKLNQAIPPEPLYFVKTDGSYLATGGTIRKPSSTTARLCSKVNSGS